MKKLLYISFFLSLSLSAQHVDKDLKPYILSFKEEAKSRGISIDTTGLVMKFIPDAVARRIFLDYQSDWTGMTYINCKMIVFNADKWSGMTAISREIVTYHELFHKFGKLWHGEAIIMSPENNGGKNDNFYINNKKAILDEAFSHYR